ncbi:MAG: oxidative damage protection protein [Wenzhouxiangellaceae bacterium]
MTATVHCILLQQQAPALKRAPYPGPLGQRILEQVSQPGWQRWLQHQTRLINEKRLSPINPEHRQYLEQQMEAFFFGGEVDQPEGYVPPEA